jgi:hypothetical protein
LAFYNGDVFQKCLNSPLLQNLLGSSSPQSRCLQLTALILAGGLWQDAGARYASLADADRAGVPTWWHFGNLHCKAARNDAALAEQRTGLMCAVCGLAPFLCNRFLQAHYKLFNLQIHFPDSGHPGPTVSIKRCANSSMLTMNGFHQTAHMYFIAGCKEDDQRAG